MLLLAQGFERFSQRLFRASGFEKVKVTSKFGDGIIDGIVILHVKDMPVLSHTHVFESSLVS